MQAHHPLGAGPLCGAQIRYLIACEAGVLGGLSFSADWQARYAIAPVLVETFVDSTRYRGTCYRTANWRHLGQTQGRGRQDRAHAALGMSKGIWVYLKDSMDLRTKQRNECCNPGRLVTVWQTNGAPPVDWRKPLIHMASPRGFEPRLPP